MLQRMSLKELTHKTERKGTADDEQLTERRLRKISSSENIVGGT